MITKDDAVNTQHGTVLYHVGLRNVDGWPVRCRVTGRCKVWKLRPDEFRLPVKYGLRQSFYITQENAGEWCESETIAMLGGPGPANEHTPFRRMISDAINGIAHKDRLQRIINARLVYADWLDERGEMAHGAKQRKMAESTLRRLYELKSRMIVQSCTLA